MAKTIPADAFEVREFYVHNPKEVPTNDKTVGRAPAEHRGRLSAPAIKTFEAKTGKTYVPRFKSPERDGLIEISYHYTQPSGKKAKVTERLTAAVIRSAAGDAAKAKGRLTEAAMEAARVTLGERKTVASKTAAKSKTSNKKTAKAAEVVPAEGVDTDAPAA